MTSITPAHVEWDEGQDNMGSIQTTVFYAALSDFESLKPINPNPTNFSEAVQISAKHVFKAGKGFKRLYSTEEKGMLEDESVGETDSKSFRNKLKIFHPGTKIQALGFARWANNTGLILLAKEADGQIRQIGSEGFPARIETNNITTGETAEGPKGMTMEASCPSPTPAPIYPFAIEEEGSSSSGV